MPSSQQNVTNIPSNRVDFIDPRTGLVSREWYRFFVNLFNLSGSGGNQTSLDDLQVGPPPMESTGSGGGGTGTVTSVGMSVPTGLSVAGSPITTSGTFAVSYTAGYAIPTTAKQTQWDTAYSDRLQWDGGATNLVAATGRTSLGATTVGGNFFTLPNPSAITFVQINADNTITTMDAPTFRTAIGAGTGGGSVTSVGTAGTVNGLTLTGGPITSSGTITLGGTLNLSSPPAIGSTTPAAGTFTTLTATGQTSLGANGANNATFLAKAGTGAFPTFTVENSSGNSIITAVPTSGNGSIVARAYGGVGSIQFQTNGGSYAEQMRVSNTASAVNYVQVTGAATTNGTVVSSQGSDANISSIFQSKGTGAIDLAAGSSGVNISNGNTVTAITRTGGGTLYTSVPIIALSAPTTAGGVQATASITVSLNSITAVVSGGTGYTVGDTLTVVGGTGTAIVLTVSTVSAGVVTAVTISNFGSYSVAPSNPMTVTGGTGTGATFTPNFGVQPAITITNAGSGYVEQPTVSFSGGGGSGAAAYATVGSASKITSLFSFLPVYGPSGFIAAFQGSSGTAANYVQFGSQSTGNYPNVSAQGSDTNVGFDLFSKGTAPVRARTGTGGATQFQISDTASAVNYVQVTGAATGGAPTISSQGSDTNTGLYFQAKGTTGSIRFSTNGANSNEQFRVSNTASAVNYLNATGAAAGASPVFSVAGSDTNIDLTLTPKGTGVLKTTAVANIGAGTVLAGATNPLVAMTGNTNQYVQSYIVNNNAGTSASSDFVAYANNSTDAHGWADMGFTSSAYADATYTVTGANEAYLFGSALNSTYTGNLVYATDSTGSANSHQFYVGGFTQAKSAWRMQITSTLLQTKGSLQLMGSSSGYVGLQAAATAGSTTYTLPAADGSTGQMLSTNGSGTLSWVTGGGGSNITAQGLWENNKTISSNYSVTSGNNALSAGPITVASGVVVTVPSGSVWTIV